MIEVTCYQTSDGVIHRDVLTAKSHADKRYGEKLVLLARAMADVGKYMAAMDFIEMNLDVFVELRALRDDMDLLRCEEVE